MLSHGMMHLLVADRNADALQVAREGLAMAPASATATSRRSPSAPSGPPGSTSATRAASRPGRCIAICKADGSSRSSPGSTTSPSASRSWATCGAASRSGSRPGRRPSSSGRPGAALAGDRAAIEHYSTGRWDQAVRIADAVSPDGDDGPPHYMKAMCHLWRGRIRLARGQPGKALEDADRALALARDTGDRLNLDPALAFGARVLLAAGQVAEAGKLLDELLATAGGRLLKPELGVDLAVSLVELGRPVEALDEVLPSRWLDAARAFAGGDPARAARIYAEIGSRPDEAAARLAAAHRLLPTRRPRAASSWSGPSPSSARRRHRLPRAGQGAAVRADLTAPRNRESFLSSPDSARSSQPPWCLPGPETGS